MSFGLLLLSVVVVVVVVACVCCFDVVFLLHCYMFCLHFIYICIAFHFHCIFCRSIWFLLYLFVVIVTSMCVQVCIFCVHVRYAATCIMCCVHFCTWCSVWIGRPPAKKKIRAPLNPSITCVLSPHNSTNYQLMCTHRFPDWVPNSDINMDLFHIRRWSQNRHFHSTTSTCLRPVCCLELKLPSWNYCQMTQSCNTSVDFSTLTVVWKRSISQAPRYEWGSTRPHVYR